jgi:hypothetical protein
MPNVSPVKFNCWTEDLAHGLHNLGSDAIKFALTNTQPSVENATLADITQIAAGGGYVTDGFAMTRISSGQVNGVYRLFLEDYTFLASGNVDPFRWAVSFNTTHPSKPLISFIDYGSPITDMIANEDFLFDFNGTSGFIVI